MIIPAMGIAAAGLAGILGSSFGAALAMGVAGAAVAAAIRALAGEGASGRAGVIVAALLVPALLVDHGDASIRAGLALAALAWTVAELARPTPISPLVALAPATLAAILEPGCVALVALVGARAVTELSPRPPWAIGLPIAGGIWIIVALVAGAAQSGAGASLAAHWFAMPRAEATPLVVATRGAEALGPIIAVAALAGLVALVRARRAELALGCAIVGAVLVDLRAGQPGALTLGLAAVTSGLAVARFSAQARLPMAQGFIAAMAGMLLLVPPAWSALQ